MILSLSLLLILSVCINIINGVPDHTIYPLFLILLNPNPFN